MKKIVFLCFAFLFPFYSFSQQENKAKSFWQLQAGLLGVWASNETNFSKQLASRSEAGVNLGFWYGGFYPKTGIIAVPVLTLEPRWYYNLAKREVNGKRTENNSANFLSFNASYNPNWFIISNYSNLDKVNQLNFGLLWGIRRTYSWFNIEGSTGLTYYYAFSKDVGYYKNDDAVIFQLNLRIGLNL
jgi:hypothetical protein